MFHHRLLEKMKTALTPAEIAAMKQSFEGLGVMLQGWQNGRADSLHPNSIFNEPEVTFFLSLKSETNRQPESVLIEREAYLAGLHGRPFESVFSRR